jgi:hypothetical protein
LPGAHALACTHHIAVAAFDTKSQKTTDFYLCTSTGRRESVCLAN